MVHISLFLALKNPKAQLDHLYSQWRVENIPLYRSLSLIGLFLREIKCIIAWTANRSHGSGIKAKCKFEKRKNSVWILQQAQAAVKVLFFCWISCKCLEPGAVRIGMGWFYVKHFHVCAPPSSPKHQSVSGFFLSLPHLPIQQFLFSDYINSLMRI